jgi:hypothetical protein
LNSTMAVIIGVSELRRRVILRRLTFELSATPLRVRLSEGLGLTTISLAAADLEPANVPTEREVCED